MNSILPIGQVTLKFCLPGALPRLPKFSNSLIIHEPKNEAKLPILTVVLLALITFTSTDTKMSSGIKFCLTASFDSASKVCEVVVVRSCTSCITRWVQVSSFNIIQLRVNLFNSSKIVFDSLNVQQLTAPGIAP